MNKGGIWLSEKMDPMLDKIPGAEVDPFNHSRPIKTCRKWTILVNMKVAAPRFGSLSRKIV